MPVSATHKVKTCPHCKSVAKAQRDYGDPLGNTPPGNPRLPWHDLTPHLRPHVDPDNDKAVAALLRVDREGIPEWRAKGIPFNTADTIAVRLGFVPANIWPAQCMALETVFRGCPYTEAVEIRDAIDTALIDFEAIHWALETITAVTPYLVHGDWWEEA